jgi:NAD(P)-dependent dehydrogenase (short-subunit alcohol dehydrogenase family)
MGSRNGKRRAVVTGAAGGIGKAVTHRLIAEGIEVLAVDTNADRLASVGADGCAIHVADLSDPGERHALSQATAGYDYLVNAAGILKVKPILEVTVEEWRTIQTVNAESVFFLCQGIGAALNPGGAIVNLSSSSAKLATSTDVAAYAASKTTILSITRSFAYAFADRPVRVNAICPAIVETEMQENFLAGVANQRGIAASELDTQRKKAVPLGRGASAEECAGAIWFLLSDEAAYMTGQAVNFTGGLVNW